MRCKYIVAAIIALSLALTACPGNTPDNTVKIASKPMTEQYILTEMLRTLIEDKTDLTVEITQGVGGGTSNIHPAMVSGEFDLYPEYTGTAWSYVLKKTDVPEDDTLYEELGKEYADKYGLEWVGLYGFNNTYGVAMRKNMADERNVTSYSTLAPHSSDLTFGAEYDFYERDDGYDALAALYGFTFGKRVDLDIGLKYQALKKGQIDIMNVFTTDGQLASPEIVLLQDDKHFFRSYYCGTVVRRDILERHPSLRPVLMMMDGILTEEDMARLNHAVESEGRDEKTVAREFLVSKGLLSE